MNSKLVLAIFALVMLSANAMNLISHEGKYAWWTVNEATGGKCTSASQCDGRRICSGLKCKGLSRLPKRPAYNYNEAVTGNRCPTSPSDPLNGRHYANRDYFCDGNRTCSVNGWCQGTSR